LEKDSNRSAQRTTADKRWSKYARRPAGADRKGCANRLQEKENQKTVKREISERHVVNRWIMR
jgi:hypothetical protein